ncbi:GNAT family N-acetyltransferase [Nocardioides sp. CPCC 205120]|uniref:GNAT family N-acetyltransferase n=1 Tax=Nocardioides sp. CPCC 205120 TaxID=3406462 RepID=UPI003B506D17
MRWTHAAAWPARIADPDPATGLVLRSLRMGDASAWQEVRVRNRAWLGRWDATAPPGSEAEQPTTLRRSLRSLLRMADAGQAMPFVIEVDGAFAGQVTVNSVVRGSAQSASIGYWIDQRYAGRGLVPRAVALAVDHCFGPGRLHRIEIAVRPENTNSLRVVEKLGLAEFGYAPRYLHIDGAWCDHRLYAITAEECPGGLRARLG